MTVKYKVISQQEVVQGKYPGHEDVYWDSYEGSWPAAIYLFDGLEPKELIATDGGEPEDNSFWRDGAWIPGALNRAYERGYKDAECFFMNKKALHDIQDSYARE